MIQILYGIYKASAAGNITISGNTVGSETVSGSITASSASTANSQIIYGIYSAGTGTNVISANIVGNFINQNTGTSNLGRTRGIFTSAGVNTISGNVISGLSSYTAQQTTLADAATIGIHQSSATAGQTVSDNTISSLINLNTTPRTDVYGIYFTGPTTGTNTVTRNFIYDLNSASSSIATTLAGIQISATVATISNNIVSIGNGVTGGYVIYGIADNCTSTDNNSYYHNTLNIGGTVSSATTSSTFSIYKLSSNGTSRYLNNLLINSRTGGSSQYHYAIGNVSNSSARFTSNYNDLFVSGTNSGIGQYNSTRYTTLATWRTISGQDASSISVNPSFINATDVVPASYRTGLYMAGSGSASITVDFGMNTRAATPNMGAWEYVIRKWKGNVSSDFGNPLNWTNGSVPSDGNDIIFDDAPINNCVLDIDRTIGNHTNNQSQYILSAGGRRLTITGTLNLTNSAFIDATTTGSVIDFSASTSQTISNNLFLNNTASGIEISGTAVVIIDADFLVTGALLINPGSSLEVNSARRLTVNGTLTNNAGVSGLILKSSSAGNASLLQYSDNVSVTAELYINGAAEAWHFLSSPVSAQALSGSWTPSGTYGNGTGYDLYAWNEATSCWVYYNSTTGSVSWSTIHPSENFVSGKGYLYSLQAADQTKQFTGILNNGSVTMPVTRASINADLAGFTLTGNPYSSYLDWQAVSGWTRSALVTSGTGYDMWIWNPQANNYGVINSAGGSGTNSVTRYIAPMQGFLVRSAVNGNISVNNLARTNNMNGPWLKKANINQNNDIQISVESATGSGSDEVVIRLDDEGKNEGSMKFFSPVTTAPSLYIQKVTDKYSVVRYTTEDLNNTMPLSFTAGSNGTFTLKSSFDTSIFRTVILEDKLLQKYTDLRLYNSYEYESSVNDDPGRFNIHFKSVSVTGTNPGAAFPASVYSSELGIIIDLSGCDYATDIIVTDITGRTIARSRMSANDRGTLNPDVKTQPLVVCLKNKAGMNCTKVMWVNN
ncbi:MAG: hypothetical protein U0X39_07590 [Bacteroidales bacterium]